MEIAAREKAEKKQQEYEERLRNMAEEMERRQTELNEAQEMIRRLEEQLKQLQAAKEELEDRQQVSNTLILRVEKISKVIMHRSLKLNSNLILMLEMIFWNYLRSYFNRSMGALDVSFIFL